MVKVKTSIRPGRFGKMLEKPEPVDPARFGDSVAYETDWEPLNAIGDSFRSYKLLRVGPDRMEFRREMRAVALSAILPLAGILILFFAFSGKFNAFAMLLGLGFILLGAYLVYSQLAPIAFDKSNGMFSKGRVKPERYRILKTPKART